MEDWLSLIAWVAAGLAVLNAWNAYRANQRGDWAKLTDCGIATLLCAVSACVLIYVLGGAH